MLQATATRGLVVGLIVSVLAVSPSSRSPQDTDLPRAVVPYSKASPDVLLNMAEWTQNYLNNHPPNGAPFGDETLRGNPDLQAAFEGYLRVLERRLLELRAALGERGLRPRAVVVPRASPPVPSAPVSPPASAADWLRQGIGNAVPMILSVTAAELARCAADQILPEACAHEFLRNARWAVPAGVLITVLSPTGAVILTGWTAVSTAGYLMIALDDARANYADDARRRQNADRATAAQMDRFADAYVQQFARHRVPAAALEELTFHIENLDIIERQLRDTFQAFGEANAVTMAATALCSDPTKLPLAAAARADRTLATIRPLAASIVSTVDEAVRTMAACASAADASRAQALYGRAAGDLVRLATLANDARAGLDAVSAFFAAVRNGRAGMKDAARQLALLDVVGEATRARAALREKTARYRGELAAHRQAVGATLVGVSNLRSAFPAVQPPHVAAAFTRMDHAYTAAMADVLTEERLDAIETTATDQVSRVEGWHRLASERFDDFRACGTVSDDAPEALRRDVIRIATAVLTDYGRAQRAVDDHRSVLARADACPSAGPSPLTGECSGTIDVSPTVGSPGASLDVRVRITSPNANQITRVVADNPGCTAAACREMPSVTANSYRLPLRFQVPAGAQPMNGVLGTFRIDVSAYAGDRLMCSGRSVPLTVRAR